MLQKTDSYTGCDTPGNGEYIYYFCLRLTYLLGVRLTQWNVLFIEK